MAAAAVSLAQSSISTTALEQLVGLITSASITSLYIVLSSKGSWCSITSSICANVSQWSSGIFQVWYLQDFLSGNMNYSTSHVLGLPASELPKQIKIYLHHRDTGPTNDLAIPTIHCRERCLNPHIKLKGFTHQFKKAMISFSWQQLQNDGESRFWRLISKFKACLEGDDTQHSKCRRASAVLAPAVLCWSTPVNIICKE